MKANIDLNRREILKGLLSVSALTAVKTVDATTISAQSPSAQLKLNIVVHGAWIFDFNIQANTLWLYAPKVNGPFPHVYLAGFWKLEQELDPKKIYKLEGISGLKSELPPEIKDPTKAYGIVRKKLQRNEKVTPACIFELPIPQAIKSGISVRLVGAKPFFNADPILDMQPTMMPLVLVLEYQIPLIASGLPVVSNLQWMPCINLHLFAEPRQDPDDAHRKHAFRALRQLYDGLAKLDLTDDAVHEKQYVGAKVPRPECISKAETRSLAHRANVGAPTPGGGTHLGTCLQLILTNEK